MREDAHVRRIDPPSVDTGLMDTVLLAVLYEQFAAQAVGYGIGSDQWNACVSLERARLGSIGGSKVHRNRVQRCVALRGRGEITRLVHSISRCANRDA